MQINGISVVESVLNTVSPYVQKVMIITNTPEEYSFLDIDIVKDVRPGFGPLSGIHSALSFASRNTGWWFPVIYRWSVRNRLSSWSPPAGAMILLSLNMKILNRYARFTGGPELTR
jgi:hypothetical protein